MPVLQKTMDPIQLEESSGLHKPVADDRPLIPEPPPVRLIAIDDVHLPAANGLERELVQFYVGMLRFVRKATEEAEGLVIFHAENQRLCFDVLEPPITRESIRPIGIEVVQLDDIEHRLLDEQTPHTRQVGLLPGDDSILLQDPAGNWITLVQLNIVF